MNKTYAGSRLRQLRKEKELTQTTMAQLLGLSASYVNQIEHDVRPLTTPVLVKIADVFGVDASFFATDDRARLLAEVQEVLNDREFFGTEYDLEQLNDLVSMHPDFVRSVVDLHRRYELVRDKLSLATDSRYGGLMRLLPTPQPLTVAPETSTPNNSNSHNSNSNNSTGIGTTSNTATSGTATNKSASNASTGSAVATNAGAEGALSQASGAEEGSADGADSAFSFLPQLAMPHEEVRDFFYAHSNYFDGLDRRAEEIAAELHISAANQRILGSGPDSPSMADIAAKIARRLSEAHGIHIITAELPGLWHRFDPATHTLAISGRLSSGKRAFRLAHELAHAELAPDFEELLATANFTDVSSVNLARRGLASYVAAAILLPYTLFHSQAEATAYDIELLESQFGFGWETICHRLSTLQRPGLRGIPFTFVRVDRAGNVSKRQSATGFPFTQSGGTCPLWNLYDTFNRPGEISCEVSAMPDGRKYLWIARTVTQRQGGYHSPTKTFAVGLGCELRHANRTVYAQEGDLLSGAVAQIGPGCRVCTREACAQRAFPAIHKQLNISAHESAIAPY